MDEDYSQSKERSSELSRSKMGGGCWKVKLEDNSIYSAGYEEGDLPTQKMLYEIC